MFQAMGETASNRSHTQGRTFTLTAATQALGRATDRLVAANG